MIALLAAALVAGSAGNWTPSRGPFIADAGPDFVEVRWSLDGGEPGELVLSSGGIASRTIAPKVEDGLARARVDGLSPDSAIAYRLHEGARWSAAGRAHTIPAAGEPVSFVVFGDTRTDDVAHAKIAARIATLSPDLVVNTGDLIENGTIEAIWPRFFAAERGMLAGSLLLPAAGNHDERNLLNDSTMRRYFPRAPWYEFTAGVVRLIFVDSNRAYDPGSAQGAWIAAHLASAVEDRKAGRIAWICVVHHHPPFSSAAHGSEMTAQRELVPVYERYGVDVVFNGHDHNYEHLEKNGIPYFVTGGGGAPLYDTGRVLPESRLHAKVFHFLQVDADAKSFSVTAIDTDGNVLDRVALAADRARPIPAPSPERDALPFAASAAAFIAAGALSWWWSGRYT